MLEERVGNGQSSENNLEEVLLELGSPRELADKYRDKKRFLIGPELYDSFITVLKIVFIILGATIGIKFIIQIVLEPMSILNYFIDMILYLVVGLPMAFGFALGELLGGFKDKDLFDQTWEPAYLPQIPDEKSQIKRNEPIIGIIFYAIFMLVFAFSSDYFGVWLFRDEFTGVVPFLNEQTYGMYRLFIMLFFVFDILKECMKLVTGKWTVKLAIMTTIVNAISFVGVLFLINRPDFWNPTLMNEVVESGIVTIGSEVYEIVSKIWDQVTFWILIVFMIGLIWEAIDGLMRARKQ